MKCLTTKKQKKGVLMFSNNVTSIPQSTSFSARIDRIEDEIKQIVEYAKRDHEIISTLITEITNVVNIQEEILHTIQKTLECVSHSKKEPPR